MKPSAPFNPPLHWILWLALPFAVFFLWQEYGQTSRRAEIPMVTQEAERQELADEGQRVVEDMKRANRGGVSTTEVERIRTRQREFERRSDAHLRAHGATPIPK